MNLRLWLASPPPPLHTLPPQTPQSPWTLQPRDAGWISTWMLSVQCGNKSSQLSKGRGHTWSHGTPSLLFANRHYFKGTNTLWSLSSTHWRVIKNQKCQHLESKHACAGGSQGWAEKIQEQPDCPVPENCQLKHRVDVPRGWRARRTWGHKESDINEWLNWTELWSIWILELLVLWKMPLEFWRTSFQDFLQGISCGNKLP